MHERCYTLHGQRGAIIVDDDAISVHCTDVDRSASKLLSTTMAASHWMDASHKEWFGRLFDEFRAAIHTRAFVSEQTVDALKCIETIGAAYDSAQQASREVEITGPEVEKSHRRRVRATGPRLVAGT